MLALFDSKSEVNVIYPIFVEKLGFLMQTTNIGAQKIDGIIFETYKMVIAAFSMTDQANRIRFFEKTFLMVNINLDVVLKIPFLTLNDANIDFSKKKLQWKSYIIEKAFFTTKWVKLVEKKKFVAAALDPR